MATKPVKPGKATTHKLSRATYSAWRSGQHSVAADVGLAAMRALYEKIANETPADRQKRDRENDANMRRYIKGFIEKGKP